MMPTQSIYRLLYVIYWLYIDIFSQTGSTTHLLIKSVNQRIYQLVHKRDKNDF